MAITDLTGTAWIFDSEVSTEGRFSSANITFTAGDGRTWELIDLQLYQGQFRIFYMNADETDGVIAYDSWEGFWKDERYRTIRITGGSDVTNSAVISYLEANATQMPTTLVGTSWKIKDTFSLTNVDFNSLNFTADYGTRNYTRFRVYQSALRYYYSGTSSDYAYRNSAWQQTGYKTIHITGGTYATNATAIEWFLNNAERVYTVSFDVQGHGTAPEQQSVVQGEKATRPTDPTATGYTFGGWYTEQACTNLFDFNTAITSDRTLYAKWTQTTPTYTVTFNANGHGTAPSSQTIEEGQKATKPTDPTATGYRFDGWFTEQACINEFDFNTPITANRTLWAKWTAAYNVTFDMHGHGTQVPPQYVESGNTATRPPDPSADGYRFDGWYTESTYTNLFDFDTPITSNITLHAKWTQVITYSVTYSTQFGSVPTRYKEQGTTLTSDDLPLLEHEGYRFGGWYLDETYHTPALGKEMTENIIVYAKWTEITEQLPLYIGNDLITKIFIGTDEISSIFIGEDRVF